MIPIKFQSVEEDRIREMKTWMSQPGWKTLEKVIESRKATLEIEYLNLTVEAEKYPAKEGQVKDLLAKIIVYKQFLETFREIKAQKDFTIVMPANANP